MKIVGKVKLVDYYNQMRIAYQEDRFPERSCGGVLLHIVKSDGYLLS